MKKRKVYPNKAALINTLVPHNSTVLDVGFLGQGIQQDSSNWPHALIKSRTSTAYGVDLAIDRNTFPDLSHYQEASAENFFFSDVKFETVFAGDLIEHLTNPGLFLDCVRKQLTEQGVLILTTPNTFNLFNLTEKISKDEPTVNKDHTCYFNYKTLQVLLEKCGFIVEEISYLYSLEYSYRRSWKKVVLDLLYGVIGHFTPKFMETLVVVARPNNAKN